MRKLLKKLKCYLAKSYPEEFDEDMEVSDDKMPGEDPGASPATELGRSYLPFRVLDRLNLTLKQ